MRVYHWTERMSEIPRSYFDKEYTQNDSMVRVRKWIITNFSEMVRK